MVDGDEDALHCLRDNASVGLQIVSSQKNTRLK